MTHPGDDRLMTDHEYDGIREYDNPLPRWWVLLFIATILFAPIYYLAPGDAGHGAKKEQMYEKEMAAYRARHPEEGGGAPTLTAERMAAIVADPAEVARGKTLFAANCAACHRADGGGLIGPNLTDDFWLHGGTPLEVRNTIWNGVLAKGMPPWGRLLKPDEVGALTAFVRSLRGARPPNPRASEGVAVKPDGTPADGGAATKPKGG